MVDHVTLDHIEKALQWSHIGQDHEDGREGGM